MKLTENECSEALTRLLRPYYAKVDVQNVYHSINKCHSIEDDSNLLTLLIQEYFGNSPLKFDELEENMWVWDDKKKEWCILDKLWEKELRWYSPSGLHGGVFEENRFYRKEVQE